MFAATVHKIRETCRFKKQQLVFFCFSAYILNYIRLNYFAIFNHFRKAHVSNSVSLKPEMKKSSLKLYLID